MLYLNADGTMTITNEPTPEWVWAEHEREKRERMAENERRYAAMVEQVARIERDAEVAAEVAERDELIEYVEAVEEAALAELAEFGCVEFEVATSDAELNEDECEPFWAFACDLYDEPRAYVLLDLY